MHAFSTHTHGDAPAERQGTGVWGLYHCANWQLSECSWAKLGCLAGQENIIECQSAAQATFAAGMGMDQACSRSHVPAHNTLLCEHSPCNKSLP